MPERREPRQQGRAQRAEQAAEAVHAMQAGQAGPAQQALHLHRLGVHRHVQGGEGQPYQQQRESQRPPALAQPQQREHQQQRRGAGQGHPPAAEAPHQGAGEGERQQCTEPGAQQRLAQALLVDAGEVLQRRDAPHGAAMHQPTGAEAEGAGPAGRAGSLAVVHRFESFLRTNEKPRAGAGFFATATTPAIRLRSCRRPA